MSWQRRQAEPSNIRYYIRIQRRCAYNGRYPPNDWRAYREFMAWPLLFPTREAGEKFMDYAFTFKGITGRKLSASIQHVVVK